MQKYHFKTLLLILLSISLNANSQNFSKPMEKEIQRIEDQTRLIIGADIKIAQELLIDTLMDNDWNLNIQNSNTGTKSAWKIVDCELFLGINATVIANLLYTLDKHNDGIKVRVSINLPDACNQTRDKNYQQTLYKKFWESSSVGKFYTSLKIEALKSE